MKLTVQAIDNASGKIVEQGDFFGTDAQLGVDAWKAQRTQLEEYGSDKAKSFAVVDSSAQYDESQKVLTRQQVREGCMKVIDQISAMNVDAKSTNDQMDAFFSTPAMVEIILALLTGAPATASRKISIVGPSLYPQATVDSIVAALSALE